MTDTAMTYRKCNLCRIRWNAPVLSCPECGDPGIAVAGPPSAPPSSSDTSRAAYPENYPACIMCGARENKPCTVISTVTDGPDQQTAGDRRDYPHAARAKPGEQGPREGFVAIKDEPDWSGPPATPGVGQ